MIYFLLLDGSRKFVQWPLLPARESVLIVFTLFSLSLPLSFSLSLGLCQTVPYEKSTLNTGFPFLLAGRQFICKISQRCNTCSRASRRSPLLRRKKKKERRIILARRSSRKICMRKRANAITPQEKSVASFSPDYLSPCTLMAVDGISRGVILLMRFPFLCFTSSRNRGT